MNQKLIYLLIILFILSATAALFTYNQIRGAEWTCIAERCIETVTGDEWVKENCKLDGNEMFCEFELNGEHFRVPLSGVDPNNMESCKEYECAVEVLVRKIE